MPALLQIQGAVPTTPWEMVTHATTVTQGVLVVLLVLSLVSWAVMLAKWLEFRRTTRAGELFMREFARTTRLEQVRQLAKRAPASPFTRVFMRGADFLGDVRAGAGAHPSGVPSGAQAGGYAGEFGDEYPTHPQASTRAPAAVPAASSPAAAGSQVEAMRLLLDSETNLERDRLGRFLPWLATIGSVSPLIGLLGTVLGVIEAFIGIATKGSGNIGAVAPGIAEALIATAAALSVAIPAVFGYNIFANRLNRADAELEAFGTEVIAMMVREGQL